MAILRLITSFNFDETGVMVVLPMLNDSPFIVTLFDFKDNFLVGHGSSLMGVLFLADTGPDNPGKQTIARNQCERSLIGITR